MRMRLIVIAAAILVLAQPAVAQVWIANCAGDEDIVFIRYNEERIVMSMRIKKAGEVIATIGFADLTQTYIDDAIVCGSTSPDELGFGGERPVTQVCMDVERQIIFVRYQHPSEERPMIEGVYCEANVQINEG